VNIFALDVNPERAARMHCDRHVVKMILESAQLLSTALSARDAPAAAWLTRQGLCYRPTHRHHPCTLWAIHSRGNHTWLEHLALALCREYTYRYGKEHASEKVIRALFEVMHGEAASAGLWLGRRRTPFVQAMQCHTGATIPWRPTGATITLRKHRSANGRGDKRRSGLLQRDSSGGGATRK